MSLRALTLAALLALPLAGQPAAAFSETEEGLGLVERGLGMIFRNLMREAAPQLDLLGRDLSGALEHLAPALKDMAAMVDDIGNYHPPERLENGDIVIRRRADAPPPPAIGEGLRGLIAPELSPEPDPAPPPGTPQIDI